MAASSEKGTQKFWYRGLPHTGNPKGSNDPGTQKFWYKGLPSDGIFPIIVGGRTTKNTYSIHLGNDNGISLGHRQNIYEK